MGFIQEPLIFREKPITANDTAGTSITLLINPEVLTINFKKVITRLRTKSRIVSLYWGQEPINFTYSGQTGNLFPYDTLHKIVAEEKARNSSSLNNVIDQRSRLREELSSANSELTTTKIARDYNFNLAKENNLAEHYALVSKLENDIINLELIISDLEERIRRLDIAEQGLTEDVKKNIVSPSLFIDNKKHTDVIKDSAKWQKFDDLRKFYEKSKNSNKLLQVLYRDWVFDGYFESFSFTDDAKSEWNWKYSLSFIVLGWINNKDTLL